MSEPTGHQSASSTARTTGPVPPTGRSRPPAGARPHHQDSGVTIPNPSQVAGTSTVQRSRTVPTRMHHQAPRTELSRTWPVRSGAEMRLCVLLNHQHQPTLGRRGRGWDKVCDDFNSMVQFQNPNGPGGLDGSLRPKTKEQLKDFMSFRSHSWDVMFAKSITLSNLDAILQGIDPAVLDSTEPVTGAWGRGVAFADTGGAGTSIGGLHQDVRPGRFRFNAGAVQCSIVVKCAATGLVVPSLRRAFVWHRYATGSCRPDCVRGKGSGTDPEWRWAPFIFLMFQGPWFFCFRCMITRGV